VLIQCKTNDTYVVDYHVGEINYHGFLHGPEKCQTPSKTRTDGQTPRIVRRFVSSRSDVDTAWRRRSGWTLLPCVFVRPSVRPSVS